MRFDSDYTMTIDGQAVTTPDTIDVINPANESCLAKAPSASQSHLDAAVAAAAQAFRSWKDMPWDRRAEMLTQFGNAIEENAEALMRLLTLEQGKPRAGAEFEVLGGAMWCKGVAEQRLPVEIAEDNKDHRVEMSHVPIGVVGAITPWNFPILLAIFKIAPALLSGNTLVLKPSPYTPLCTLKLGEIARAIFPPGVFNVLTGGDELGKWMTEHEGIGKITFTGSTATGKKIMQSGSGNLKRLTLELGGNDPAIVLPDVDPKTTAPQIFWAAFQNSAQFCVACKRLYVHESIYDAFMEELVSFAKTVKLEDGARQGTDLGPIQNRMQYEKVKDLLSATKAAGENIVLGGEAEDRPGYFIPVTIVDNPSDQSRVVTEEAFGPVLPVMKYNDIEEVIHRANDTDYGLAASVWSRDIDAAQSIARRIEAGVVWINEVHIGGPNFAFGGHKQSGIGVENSLHGLAEYTNIQTIMINKTNAV